MKNKVPIKNRCLLSNMEFSFHSQLILMWRKAFSVRGFVKPLARCSVCIQCLWCGVIWAHWYEYFRDFQYRLWARIKTTNKNETSTTFACEDVLLGHQLDTYTCVPHCAWCMCIDLWPRPGAALCRTVLCMCDHCRLHLHQQP